MGNHKSIKGLSIEIMCLLFSKVTAMLITDSREARVEAVILLQSTIKKV